MNFYHKDPLHKIRLVLILDIVTLPISNVIKLISFTLLYWYVWAWEFWRNAITGHMGVTQFTIQWKWWLQVYESVSKLFFMLWATQLAEKGRTGNCIYQIIIFMT